MLGANIIKSCYGKCTGNSWKFFIFQNQCQFSLDINHSLKKCTELMPIISEEAAPPPPPHIASGRSATTTIKGSSSPHPCTVPPPTAYAAIIKIHILSYLSTTPTPNTHIIATPPMFHRHYCHFRHDAQFPKLICKIIAILLFHQISRKNPRRQVPCFPLR